MPLVDAKREGGLRFALAASRECVEFWWQLSEFGS